MKILILMTFVFSACGYKNTELKESPISGNLSQEGVITFATIKNQILGPQCLRCHSSAGGNRGGVNLETYANVKARLTGIQSAINNNFMPPSGALAQNLKTLFNTWVTGGAIENSSGATPAPPTQTPETPPNTGRPPGESEEECEDDRRMRLDAGLLVHIESDLFLDLESEELIRRRCDSRRHDH